MVKKYTLTLDREFVQFCELNNIQDVENKAKETFNRGFTILKYGETPSYIKGKEVIIEKEVIKEVEKIVEVIIEKLVEVPVEIIREVIREVPVEVEVIKEVQGKSKTKTIIKEVVKEVPIEVIKEIVKIDEIEIIRLKTLNEKLQKELDGITDSLTKINKVKYMKNSNLNSLYDE